MGTTSPTTCNQQGSTETGRKAPPSRPSAKVEPAGQDRPPLDHQYETTQGDPDAGERGCAGGEHHAEADPVGAGEGLHAKERPGHDQVDSHSHHGEQERE